MVERQKLNRWKFGGFGMYSEMHPYKNIIGLNGDHGGAERGAQAFLQNRSRRGLVRELKTLPTSKALLQKLAGQAEAEGIKLERVSVYGYDFEPSSGKLSRHLIHSHDY